MIGEITFPCNRFFFRILQINLICQHPTSDRFRAQIGVTALVDFKVEAVFFNTKFQQKTTNSNIDTDTLLSIIFVTQKTPIHHGGFDGDFWISLQEVISVNYHLNQDLSWSFAVDYESFFLAPWRFQWIKIFACPEKKQQTWRPFWHLRPRHVPRQGRGGIGFSSFSGGIYIQRKMITVHWGDVCVFWLYIYSVYI